jgi:Ca2+-binding RTX toxin-like protein
MIMGTSGSDDIGVGITTSGDDVVNGRGGDDRIEGLAGDDRLYGSAGFDILIGGADNDRLVGGVGLDEMAGGDGNDRYYVDAAGDVVSEASGEGVDTVWTTLSSYTLVEEVERLRFVGIGDFTGTGNELANRLWGGSGSDVLAGALGNDRLDGRLGADTMDGGGGNDTYHVDDANDRTIEATGGGTDTVFASVNYTLEAGEEVELLRGVGQAGLMLTGNEFDNRLLGTVGDDVLDGGAGNDRILAGDGSDLITTSGASAMIDAGEGNDTIRIDGPSTSFGHVEGGAGTDTVRSADLGVFEFRSVEVLDTYYGFLNASVTQLMAFDTYTADLAAADAQISITLRGAGGTLDFTTGIGGQNSVEIRDGGITSAIYVTGSVNADVLSGSSFNDKLFGGTGNDALLGGEGRDALLGGADNDRLNGGSGDDRVTGGDGDDVFVFDSPIGGGVNIDRIADFTSGSDTIEIDQQFYFLGLTPGQLDASQFAIGAATGAGPQIVYNPNMGTLHFDSNGAQAGGSTLFAVLMGAPELAATDILIV